MPFRHLLAIFSIALAVAGTGHTVYWFHVAGELRKSLEHWAEQRRTEGWEVAWGESDIGGYPAHLILTLDQPRLASPQGFAWSAERVTGNAEPFNLTRLRLTAPGQHRLRWNGGTTSLTASDLRADVDVDRAGKLEEVTLLGSGVRIEPQAGESLEIAGLALTWDPLPVAKPSHLTATVRFSATAQDVILPPMPGLVLDRKVGLVEATGRVMGVLPMDGTPRSVLRWAGDGGTVELDHVSLEWEPMALEAEGTLALDPRSQPMAALSARVRGFAPLMERLVAAGSVEPAAAGAAKLLLSLMSRPDSKGRAAVPVPVTMQDGALFLGPARVATIPAFPVQ